MLSLIQQAAVRDIVLEEIDDVGAAMVISGRITRYLNDETPAPEPDLSGSPVQQAAVLGLGNLESVPEDLIPFVFAFCKLWKVKYPAIKDKQAQWIRDTWELKDACGEFGVKALEEYHVYYKLLMDKNHGLCPFQNGVNGPGTLLNVVRGKAALMRAGQDKKQARFEGWSE